MKIETSRFGVIEVQQEELISFPKGLIGFPAERDFILIPHPNSAFVAWLQSASTKDLAFPVVSAHSLGTEYPDVELGEVIDKHDLGETLDELAILVVLSAPRNLPATVNLLAPLLINADLRRGAQVFLEGSRFTTRELFVLPEQEAKSPEQEPQSEAAAL